ncbi:MAG: carboxypeptidase regulatory-like domain-containing protein [Acidobacteriota bacterium]|nr:carboxypeptidase regulatory-like domain-containing protein [Acidobacteriota bacterium]
MKIGRRRVGEKRWLIAPALLAALLAALLSGWVGGEASAQGRGDPIFSDGFESGDTLAWSAVQVGDAPGAPSLSFTAPVVVIFDQTRPSIQLSFDDPDGVDLGSFRLTVDGIDQTAGCTLTATTADCLPPALTQGRHRLTAQIADVGGEVTNTLRSFDLFFGPGPHTLVLEAEADAWISGFDTGFSGGSAETLRVGTELPGRGLLRFAGEPLRLIGGRNLLSADLELTLVANGGGWGAGSEVAIHALVLTPWMEPVVTWDCATDADGGCDAPWDGGVFSPATDAVLHTNDLSGTVTFDVAGDVEAVQRGADNFGWMLKKADETVPGGVDYGSREGGEAARLELVFEAPPGPGGDTAPPQLSFSSPSVPVFQDAGSYQVVVGYQDRESGIDLSSLRVLEDSVDRTGFCQVQPATATCTFPASAADGDAQLRTVRAEVTDEAGNPAAAELEVALIYGPGDVLDPLLTISSPPEGALVNTPTVQVTGTATDDGELTDVVVAGVPVPIAGGVFTTQVPLHGGENIIPLLLVDGAGRSVMGQRTVTYDPVLPDLQVLEPASGLSTNAATVRVAGLVFDLSGISTVQVNGATVPVVDGTFETVIDLQDGLNSISVHAVDTAGNLSEVIVEVTRFAVPEVAITAPLSFQLVGATVDVEGTVSPGTAAVEVNGVAAAVDSGAGTFFAAAVPVHAGVDLLTATATDGTGRVASATVTVVRDDRPPQLVVVTPVDGARLAEGPVTVSGRVRDPDLSAAGTAPPQVTVNGTPATVMQDTFAAEGLVLAPGANVLTVEATDQAGNVTQEQLTVFLEVPTAPRLRVISGDRQSAVIDSPLAEPLVVQALDGAGLPVAGAPVLFRVTGGAGSLDDGSGGERRQVAKLTDGSGEASVSWTLGSRAGLAVQRLEASAAGFGEPLQLGAIALPGPPALLVVDDGGEQTGAVGQRLPLPLVTTVVDAGFNRLPGVAVDFTIVAGEGSLVNAGEGSGAQATVTTDRDGNAAVGWVLGSQAGSASDVVEVTLAGGGPTPYASFVANARVAGDPALTALSGLVLDNSDEPVPDATVEIAGTGLSVLTDAAGAFRLDGVPPGMVLLEVDGATTSRPGIWPHLEFQVATVAGIENTMGRPIYLLPLDPASGVAVDETTGGTVTLPDYPGFALDIAPGSVTFPDGSSSGVVSVTVVHGDKVPMVPNFGQQPRLVVTIQPGFARFDPPARLTLPNVDGLDPGAVTEMYSFDHDLFRFVTIGQGVVSEDGLTVTSVPGSGVIEAGWHCGGNPAGSGTTHNCPTCKRCVNNRCVEDNSQTPPQSAPDDCLREICIHGFVFPTGDSSETPPQTPGDCLRAECITFGGGGFGVPPTGRVREVGDLSDPPPGQACCGVNGSTTFTPDIYDPSTECCTPFFPRVVQKHPMPITWPVDCPNRSTFRPPNPGNGCGSPVLPLPVPEDPNIGCENASFTPACNTHDMCYDRCRSDQGTCDAQFLADMRAACAAGCSNILARAFCRANADRYFSAVSSFGGLPWFNAQRNACQCC